MGAQDRSGDGGPATSADIARAFLDTGDALFKVQSQLGALEARGAADPWQQQQDRVHLEELARRRDALLDAWARQALSWRMRGGEVRLVGNADDRVSPGEAPTHLPTLAAAAPAGLDEPAVVTRRVVAGRRVFEPGATETTTVVTATARPAPPRDVDHARLTELIRMLGEPTTPLDSIERTREELMRLTEGTSTGRLDEWARFPKPIQKAMVGMVVARARHLQDEVAEDLMPVQLSGDLDRLFSAMTGYSKREQPGFVFGLQRHHHPMGVTWLADARRWWADLIDHLPEPAVLSPTRALGELRRRIEAGADEADVLEQAETVLDANMDPGDGRLVTLLTPYLDALGKKARFKHLRNAIRDTLEQDAQDEAELSADDAELPQDWPPEGLVEGRRVAVVGGPLTDETKKAMGSIFRWADAQFVDGENPRVLEDLAESARDGDLDLVIVLRRFVGDDADRVLIPVCDDHDVAVADVDRGFGLAALLDALEVAHEDMTGESL
ncbi:MAG: hypothetical protein H6742_00670 [Alphaproteobacteria bacterium]|nr:hypothetical protein [Alphaproteobacteria bacterium]